jgi:hypothetical protein
MQKAGCASRSARYTRVDEVLWRRQGCRFEIALSLHIDIAESIRTTTAPSASALSESVAMYALAETLLPAWAGNTQSEIVDQAAGARCKVSGVVCTVCCGTRGLW